MMKQTLIGPPEKRGHSNASAVLGGLGRGGVSPSHSGNLEKVGRGNLGMTSFGEK